MLYKPRNTLITHIADDILVRSELKNLSIDVKTNFWQRTDLFTINNGLYTTIHSNNSNCIDSDSLNQLLIDLLLIFDRSK